MSDAVHTDPEERTEVEVSPKVKVKFDAKQSIAQAKKKTRYDGRIVITLHMKVDPEQFEERETDAVDVLRRWCDTSTLQELVDEASEYSVDVSK